MDGPKRPVLASMSAKVVEGKNRGDRNLKYQEFMSRREKGRCFRCDQPYHPLHQCPNKTLRTIILAKDEPLTEGEVGVSRDELGAKEETCEADCGMLELPLYSIAGIAPPHTMKFKGELMGVSVVIMIDSGASHNFISRCVVSSFGLLVELTPRFGV